MNNPFIMRRPQNPVLSRLNRAGWRIRPQVGALACALVTILNLRPILAEDTPSTPAKVGVVLPGATLAMLSHEFEFTEGPTADAAGNVFFTDQPNDRIMKWSTDGKLSTFLQPAGRANGMYFDAKGNLIACADEKTELWSI